MSNTWPSCSRARAPANSSISPQVVYSVGTSASFPIRLVTAPTRPTSGSSSGRIRRGSQPGGTSVSLFSSTSTSPRASASPWLQARAKPALSGFSTRRTRGFARRELVQLLRRAVARAVVDHDQLVAGVLGAGEHALQAIRVNSRLSWVTITMLAAGHGQGCTCRSGTGGRAIASTVSCGRRVGRRETGVMSRSGGNGAVPWLRTGYPRPLVSSTPTSPEQARRAPRRARSTRARSPRRRGEWRSIVGVDRLDRGEDLVHGREREQPLAGREHVAEAGVLVDHRAARRPGRWRCGR